MRILGIETSCDETAAAVVENGKRILAHTVVSSLKQHRKFGGIIPEIASRRQLECIEPIVRTTLEKSACSLKKVDAIAVTTHPGLIGSLLVGTSFAQALSRTLKKPYIPVDHIQAHLYANCLYEKQPSAPYPRLPAIGLVVSGGHTSLFRITDWQKPKLIGHTRDDAAGEAFDKVARILELGYPGGPAIEKIARTAKVSQLAFKPAWLPGTLDFSFSGIKTAVLYHVREHKKITHAVKADIARAFQESVVEVLVAKTLLAAEKYGCPTILVGGGVAANGFLRQVLLAKAQERNCRVFFPPLSLCLDNAAMIAGLAYHLN